MILFSIRKIGLNTVFSMDKKYPLQSVIRPFECSTQLYGHSYSVDSLKKAMNDLRLILVLFLAVAQPSLAQLTPPAKSDSIMITIFLKHQQDKNLDSLQFIQKLHNFSGTVSASQFQGCVLVCDDGNRTGCNC